MKNLMEKLYKVLSLSRENEFDLYIELDPSGSFYVGVKGKSVCPERLGSGQPTPEKALNVILQIELIRLQKNRERLVEELATVDALLKEEE